MKKPVITLLHIGYWLVYLLLLVVILLSLQVGTKLTTHSAFRHFRLYFYLFVFAVIPALTGFYSFYSVLFSRFLAKKKLGWFFCTAVTASLAGGLMGALVLTMLAWNKIGMGIFADGLYSALPIIIIMSIIALLNGITGLVMKGFISWYNDIKLKEDLNRKNHETELALIRSQLDPHFLFNTINNIDVLITMDAARASQYLNKLSGIMRFMLYETKAAKIPLQKELDYIEKYLELQKIRSANPGYINYKVTGNAAGWMISPMLFIPFIENACKHSENRTTDNAIKISLGIENDSLLFECENSCNKNLPLNNAPGGLGNELIEKRLALLYLAKHELSIDNNKDTYKVKLRLFNT